jgi:hypothetical protein
MNCVVLSLLFPYHRGVWLVLLVAVATSILLFLWSRRFPYRRGLRRSLVAVAVFVLVFAAVFGLVGPVMVQPAPTYVFLAPEWNPLKSHIVESPAGAPSVVVFADPLRKLLRWVWQSLTPYRVRLLAYDAKAGGFLVFPMHGARLNAPTLPAGTSSRYLRIDALLPEVFLDLPPTTSADGWAGLRIGPHTVLDVERHTNGIAGWNAVFTQEPPTDDELVYTATFDAGLSLLVFGTYSAALSTLDMASTLAPSPGERVRVLCTIAGIVSQLISGSLGDFQSLVIYNAAYKALPPSISAEILQRQPALAWSVKELVKAYSSRLIWTKWGSTPNRPRNPYQSRADKLAGLLPPDTQNLGTLMPRRLADEMDQMAVVSDRLKSEPKSSHDLAVAALDKFSASLEQLIAKNPVEISYGLGPEFPISRTFDLDDGQFLQAGKAAEHDPSTAFRFVEQATLEFATMLSHVGPSIQSRLTELRRITVTKVDTSARDGLLQRLDWLQAMTLIHGIIKADGPATAVEDLMRGDPRDILLDQLPCMSLPRITLLFLAAYGPWDKAGPLPPGFPPPPVALPDDVKDWWDPRFLASVCYRISAMTAISEAGPASQDLLQDTLKAIIGPPDGLMSDRKGRVFMPWKLLMARLQEDGQTYEFDELREELEKQLGLRYSEIIGQDSNVH